VGREVDFITAYNSIWMWERGVSEAITSDAKHFSRVGGIKAIGRDEVV